MIKDKLCELQDLEYRDFSLKLLPKDTKMIGVRLPILRKLSKEVSLEEVGDETFEEIMLQGMIIGHIQDFIEFKKACLCFLPKICNWSICDSFVSGLKITKKYPKEMLEFLKELVNHKNKYTRRFVFVVLLHDYLKEEYIEEVLTIIKNISKEEYEVGMACSWLLAELYSQKPQLTLVILSSLEYNLNRFIFQKTISKIHDSKKIPDVWKEELKDFRKNYEVIWEEDKI